MPHVKRSGNGPFDGCEHMSKKAGIPVGAGPRACPARLPPVDRCLRPSQGRLRASVTHARRRTPRRVGGALVAVLLLMSATAAALTMPPAALADSNNVPVSSVTVERLDATVTKTTIVAAYATAHDIVEVYNYVPVQVSADWRLATSMENATWVFKPGGGVPKLAIFFTTEAGVHVARIYDDQLAEGAAPVTIKNNRVVLGHPLHWTLKAETKQPWLLPDGRPATQLQIQSAFSLPHEDDAMSFLAHRWHGHDAWDFQMVDPTGSGTPEYTLLQLHPQLALTAAAPHTELDLNVANYRVTPFVNSIFWPYLGVDDFGVRSWFDHRPPLSMNWSSGQLRDFGSIIPDLEPENGFQIASETAILDNQVNDLDFENPFAYYRFDSGHTGFPNLIVRHFYYPPGDQFIQLGGAPEPAEFVRYSWGNGDGLMQYKLGLLGRHGTTATLNLGRFSVNTLAYATLPTWVVSRMWDFETFVASEVGGYRSSEGIYDWEYEYGDFSWAFGDISSLPLGAYSSISVGMRGEYRVLPSMPPQLYIDSVDQRLHLVGAEFGVWDVDNQQTINTATLDGTTVGQWVRNVDGVPREAVYALPGALVYASAGALTLQADQRSSDVTALAPPTDEASLNALRQRQPVSPPNIAADGLRTIVDPSGPAQVTLTGVSISSVRTVATGWRAELQVGAAPAMLSSPGAPIGLVQAFASALGCPSSSIAGAVQLVSCAQPAGTGRYILQYDGTWSLRTATPPQLRILALQAGSGTPTLAEMPVTITVGNTGTSDSTGQTLQVWAQRPGRQRVEIARLALSIPASEQRQFSLSWLPSGPGTWTVGATLSAAAYVPAAEAISASTTVVLDAEPAPAWWTLGPVPSQRLIGIAIALLAFLGLLTATTVWTILL